MPLYSYRCDRCGNERDEIREIKGRNWPKPCGKCSFGLIERNIANETITFFGDIPPYFDRSLGQKVTGRRDKVEKYRAAGFTPVAAHHGGDSVRIRKQLYHDEKYYNEVIKGDEPNDYQRRVEDLMES